MTEQKTITPEQLLELPVSLKFAAMRQRRNGDSNVFGSIPFLVVMARYGSGEGTTLLAREAGVSRFSLLGGLKRLGVLGDNRGRSMRGKEETNKATKAYRDRMSLERAPAVAARVEYDNIKRATRLSLRDQKTQLINRKRQISRILYKLSSGLSGESPATRFRQRYKSDPEFRASKLSRSKFYMWLVRRVNNGFQKYVGCSRDQLERHIEQSFAPGMSWLNRGPVWHIDHIKPLVDFNMADRREWYAAYHFSNFKATPPGENIRNGLKAKIAARARREAIANAS